MKRIKKIMISLLLVFVCVFSFVIAPFGSSYTYTARAESVAEFELRNVLDDLENSYINGEDFSLKNYNFDTTKKTQVISFLEYGYSFYESLQGNFGLYFYVYNPKGLKFVSNSSLNSITFKIGDDDTLKYEKNRVSVLNYSQGDYSGLFYKLKVVLTEEQRQNILSKLNSTERVYCVSEIELLEEGKTNATSFETESIYKFRGYMSGFGADPSAESSLECSSERLETLHLSPEYTVYRPEGTNGKNDYTQDSLHSVYFAVPNKLIEIYGEMTAVHATWLNAVLKPALVTGNQEAYAAIQNYLGVDTSTLTSDDLKYAYISNYKFHSGMGNTGSCDFLYAPSGFSLSFASVFPNNRVNPLYMILNSGSSDNSADTYIASRKEIRDRLIESATKYGGELINGKYAACMFQSVDDKFTEMNIYRDDDVPLDNFVIGDSWWDKLWGIKVDDSLKDIKAIYTVSDSDFTGDAETDCNHLYIGKQDYAEFKQYYDNNKSDNTIYLLRYQVSDYVSQEASLCTSSLLGWAESNDTNAYFFQETVNLDFDIIDVTFTMGEKETVIPVVMSPIDVIPDATPPVHTTSDNDDLWGKLMKLVYLILGLLLLIVLFPVLSSIVSFIVNLCVSVVKMIVGMLSSIFKKR